MSDVKTFFVSVYQPISIHEYEIDVHPDLIGLDDEKQANNSVKQEAMRIAMQKARNGENKETNNICCEFIALMWGEDVEIMSTFILEDGKKDLAELRALLTKHAPEATAVFQKIKEMEDESRQWSTSRNSDDKRSGNVQREEKSGNCSADVTKSCGERRKTNHGQRASTRNESARRVAKVQRRRKSRSG